MTALNIGLHLLSRHNLVKLCGAALLGIVITACNQSSIATSTHTPIMTSTPAPRITTAPTVKGTWETFDLTSQALADNLIGDPATRTIHVYLPPGYEASDERYPVVYALHGYTEDFSYMQGMGLQLNSLITDDELREMILVLPDGDNKFGGSQYLSSPTIGDYESYISQELVEYVDSNYRTIPNRDARGITGCSMGGNGALHLAFKFPDIFSSAAAVSGGYAYENYPQWEQARTDYWENLHPEDLVDIAVLPWYIKFYFAFAAAVAPNPDNPPFYFDFPLKIVDGETRNVAEVLQKISDSNVIHDVNKYLDQPIRLRGVVIYHGVDDSIVPLEMASSFSDILTGLNVEHEYIEVDDGHCDVLWDYTGVLKFMSANLADE